MQHCSMNCTWVLAAAAMVCAVMAHTIHELNCTHAYPKCCVIGCKSGGISGWGCKMLKIASS